MTTEYTPVCVLRRCGQIEGCKDARLPVFDSDANGNIVEMELNGKQLVLDDIWQQISKERCAQFCGGYCLTRKACEQERAYCYPVASTKRPNKVVAVMFAWWCVDIAEETARASARAARAAREARAARAAAGAARAAAGAARAAEYTADAAAYAAAYAARAAAEYAADAAVYAARAAEHTAARAAAEYAADAAEYTADAAAYAAGGARDTFYLKASREIERLVNAWGTPRSLLREDG